MWTSAKSMDKGAAAHPGCAVGLFCGRAITLQRALAALRRDKGIVLP
jgi:hypothetical protein